MTAKYRVVLVLTLLAMTSLLGRGQAIARPPAEAAPSKSDLTVLAPTPLIGRVRVRGEIVDLTRVSIAEGGPAHDLAQGTARVMADVEIQDADERAVDPLAKALDTGVGRGR